jgi:uncharacterized protein
MKIIAISDTHSAPLPEALLHAIDGADLLLHAGDISDLEVYQQLRKRKAIRAVWGNVDGHELRKVLPEAEVFDCEGVKIGLVHGEGHPGSMIPRLQKRFEKTGVNVVVFGHSHCPCHEMIDGVLFFNPGSPTDTIRAPYCSYGLLELNNGKVKARIVRLK